ncbi:MAG: histidine phosphatase family protein [Novosphingobium sp.]|nr:histidine phosphatase family protein [Novosphingobium sp.]
MSRCWLLRHGSSHSNEAGASSDSWSISITSTGEREAREAALQWSRIAPSTFRLVSSPMLRALQTAQHIQALHPHVPIDVIDALREFEPFDFSHLPPMKPIDRKPLMQSYWAKCDPDLVGDGTRAESFAHFRRRVEGALTRLRSSDVDTLAVCHGGVIKLAELLLDGGSERLDERALMRAWVNHPTIRNCGMHQFSDRSRPS